MSKYSVPLFFFVTGIFLLAVAKLIGSHVGANGVLVEPAFFCIPLGYLSLLISFIAAVVTFIKKNLLR